MWYAVMFNDTSGGVTVVHDVVKVGEEVVGVGSSGDGDGWGGDGWVVTMIHVKSCRDCLSDLGMELSWMWW